MTQKLLIIAFVFVVETSDKQAFKFKFSLKHLFEPTLEKVEILLS